MQGWNLGVLIRMIDFNLNTTCLRLMVLSLAHVLERLHLLQDIFIGLDMMETIQVGFLLISFRPFSFFCQIVRAHVIMLQDSYPKVVIYPDFASPAITMSHRCTISFFLLLFISSFRQIMYLQYAR